MRVWNYPQGSEDWENIRRGRPTASRFADIVTAAKGELSKSASGYIHELIAESFVTDQASAFTGTSWMDRGRELEPEARIAFGSHTGLDVTECGFITRDDLVVGCSPDGLILDPVSLDPLAGLEMKCPAPKKHVEIVAAGVLPLDYRQQVHGGMVVTGLNEWHFWSYCPGMRPFHIITCRDEYTARLEVAIDQFLIDYAAAREALIPKLKLSSPHGQTH